MTHVDRDTNSNSRPPDRRELLLLAVVLACGFALRLAQLQASAVEHFDEGVYASNRWFLADEGYEYPGRHLYAPPLLPWLIEWSMTLFGAGHWGTMLPTLLAGCATLPLVWWVARSWFGPRAGLSAVVLASLSDIHALYSRTALTDVSLCFWLLLSVFATWKSLTTGRHRWTLLAGTATGLAWWTKYNGWLPLAIGLAGLVPWVWFGGRPGIRDEGEWTGTTPRQRGRLRGGHDAGARSGGDLGTALGLSLLRWGAITLLAAAVWSPVLISLQSQGGYAGVAANHSRYVVGPTGWIDSFIRQAAIHHFLSGSLSCLGMTLALVLPALPARLPGSTWNRTDARSGTSGGHTAARLNEPTPGGRQPATATTLCLVAAGLLAGGLSAVAGATTILALLGVAGIIVWFLPVRERLSRQSGGPGFSLQVWLLAAWFSSLLLVTPMYWPYPRLTLPWLMASWLGTAALVGRLDDWLWSGDWAVKARPRSALLATGGIALGVGLACLVIAGSGLLAKRIPAWQTRTGLEEVSAKIVDDVAYSASGLPRDPAVPADFVIYVYGEPPLFFHLSRISDQDDSFAVQPAGNLGITALPVPTYLVVGPHALRNERFRRDWQMHSNRFRLIATYEEDASDLVLLNHYPPTEIGKGDSRPLQEVQLYLLEP